MNNIKEKAHIHFIGIGGCGVSALAQIAHGHGYEVTGSDLNDSIYVDKVKELGIKVFIGKHVKENIVSSINLVVRSSAVKDSNVEVVEAKNKKIPVIKHSEFLGILMEQKY